MEKIIKGRKYNTDTAAKLVEYSIGLGPKQVLFLKRTGEFFLFINDKKIAPLKDAEAREWIRGNVPEMYDNIFKENDTQRVEARFWLDKSSMNKLRVKAVDANITFSALMNQIVNEYLKGK